MIGSLHALYETLNAIYDLGGDHLGTAALHAICIEAVVSSVPPVEVEWHAHKLRRRLTDQYRAIGYVLHEGQYSVPGLRDVIGELVAERAVS